MNGRARLVYELSLKNVARAPVRIIGSRVLDARGTRLREWTGEALVQMTAREAVQQGHDPLTLEPGAEAVMYIEIDLPADSVPSALRHELAYAQHGAATATTALRVAVRREPVPVLGPPVRGGPWVAVYHPSWQRGHRRVRYTVDGVTRIPGRHAVDWIRVDQDGRTATGDPDVVASWLGQGEDVLAVADAEVVAVRDDVAESPRISTHPVHPIEDATGNYVALDLGNGRFAFYEHLAPGSIRVRVGDRVHRGQVIGAVGFTGHTRGPHLHFHVADAPSPLGAEGVPFVVECFDERGQYEDIGALGKQPWRPSAARRQRETPAPNTVVSLDC